MGACATKSESDDAACQAGAELCPCLSNGGCDDGLICATNLNRCVRLAGSTGGTTGDRRHRTAEPAAAHPEPGAAGTGGAGGKGDRRHGDRWHHDRNRRHGDRRRGRQRHRRRGDRRTPRGKSGTGGNGTGGSGTGGNGTGGSGTGGNASTSCGTLSPSANGNGEFTHYNFGQGTAKGELGDYQTACGYLGTESNQTDTVMNIANSSPAKNTYFAAIPGDGSFNTSGNCGACVQISNNGKTIIATIIDECPESSNPICQQNASGELDLSVDAFNQLGFANGNPSGTSWKVVPCPVTGNVVVRVKQANELYIENVILAVKSVSGPGGNASRTSYGSWHFNSNISGGAQLTLTDAASRTLTVTVSSTSVDQNQDTGKQFPNLQVGRGAGGGRPAASPHDLDVQLPVLVAPHSRIHIAMYISGPRADEMSPRSSTSVQPNDFRSAATCLLRLGVVAADEHGVVAAADRLGIDHHRRADRVERLDHLQVGERGLNLLGQAALLAGQHGGWHPLAVIELVRDVDEDLRRRPCRRRPA